MPRLKAILLSLATTCAPVALAQTANPAVPGTINYVEGSASIGGQPLNQQSVGYARSSQASCCKQQMVGWRCCSLPGCFFAWEKTAQ